ncbi:MAG: ABC transporter permease subunit [Armatimonadota bacterium]
MVALTISGELPHHAAYSLGRLISGVFIGTVTGVFAAVVILRSEVADVLLAPMIQLLAGVPVIVWMPFWIMIFGTGETFKVAMAAITAFFLVQGYSLHAMRSIQTHYLEVAAIYEKGHWEVFLQVLLPAALPSILTAVRVTLALGWVVIFFVEYASATEGRQGLGWLISDARGVGKTEEEFAGLMFLGLLAFISDSLFAAVQRHQTRWADTIETRG